MLRLVSAMILALCAPAALAVAQEETAAARDARWLERCRSMETQKDDRRHCEVMVEGRAAPGSALRIESALNGGVQVLAWERDSLEVHARIEGRHEDAARAQAIARAVRLEIMPGEVRVVGPDEERWSASLVVYVPRRTGLGIATSNGPLSVAGVEGKLELSTRNGPLHLDGVAGDVTARAVNGPLSVELTGSAWRGAGLDAETQNGPLRLVVPPGYSADLETGTVNGPFHSEIPITLEPGERFPRRFHATLGSGGAPVRVVTTNGPVQIVLADD